MELMRWTGKWNADGADERNWQMEYNGIDEMNWQMKHRLYEYTLVPVSSH